MWCLFIFWIKFFSMTITGNCSLSAPQNQENAGKAHLKNNWASDRSWLTRNSLQTSFPHPLMQISFAIIQSSELRRVRCSGTKCPQPRAHMGRPNPLACSPRAVQPLSTQTQLCALHSLQGHIFFIQSCKWSLSATLRDSRKMKQNEKLPVAQSWLLWMVGGRQVALPRGRGERATKAAGVPQNVGEISLAHEMIPSSTQIQHYICHVTETVRTLFPSEFSFQVEWGRKLHFKTSILWMSSMFIFLFQLNVRWLWTLDS